MSIRKASHAGSWYTDNRKTDVFFKLKSVTQNKLLNKYFHL